MPTSEQAERILAALAESNQRLETVAEKVDVQDDVISQLQSTTEHQGVVSRRTTAGLAIDILLTVAAFVLGYFLNDTQQQANEIQAAQQVQTTKTRVNQCALINLFLDFEKGATTNPALSEQERADRVRSYAEIHRIHDALECAIK